jgi:hypothetical protein
LFSFEPWWGRKAVGAVLVLEAQNQPKSLELKANLAAFFRAKVEVGVE